MQSDSVEQQESPRMVILLDVDNTLYKESVVNLGGQMREAIIDFVAAELQMPRDECEKYILRLFQQYGLTLCGLVREETGIDPTHFSDYVYAHCDFSGLQSDPTLLQMLRRMEDSHKYHLLYFTNAPIRHAQTVLQRIGLHNEAWRLEGFSYEDQWAQTRPNPSNKPMRAAYDGIYAKVETHLGNPDWLSPSCMVMVDDSEHNLMEPLALGWWAVWVAHGRSVPTEMAKWTERGKLACIEDIRELENALRRLTLVQ